ncbi:MAG: hypothetical protein HYU73_20995 [Betaproteobacteria bacterium]|nr:hypothetical protein [Betaproteobacteria bacterium]MBI3055378.1 hypothetical protein [Betaproteobacteria bacterium]
MDVARSSQGSIAAAGAESCEPAREGRCTGAQSRARRIGYSGADPAVIPEGAHRRFGDGFSCISEK